MATSQSSNLATGILESLLTCIRLTAKSFLRIILYFERSVPLVFATDFIKHLSILTPIRLFILLSIFLSSTLSTNSSMDLYIMHLPIFPVIMPIII